MFEPVRDAGGGRVVDVVVRDHVDARFDLGLAALGAVPRDDAGGGGVDLEQVEAAHRGVLAGGGAEDRVEGEGAARDDGRVGQVVAAGAVEQDGEAVGVGIRCKPGATGADVLHAEDRRVVGPPVSGGVPGAGGVFVADREEAHGRSRGGRDVDDDSAHGGSCVSRGRLGACSLSSGSRAESPHTRRYIWSGA